MNFETLVDVSPYSWHSIGTALFCGAIIGLERQIRGKPVGIRTSTLIVLGTYLFLSTAFMLKGDVIDHSRVVGQIITGIGFLGAGVMLAKDGAIVGVTSAATIWVLASIGVMIATDHLFVSIKVSLLVVAILYGVDALEENVKMFGRGVHAKVKSYGSRAQSKRHTRLHEQTPSKSETLTSPGTTNSNTEK
ncbi:MAG: putative Mg2+ transporter-C (MgtC) family protein [Oleiphilaceae bacterium]